MCIFVRVLLPCPPLPCSLVERAENGNDAGGCPLCCFGNRRSKWTLLASVCPLHVLHERMTRAKSGKARQAGQRDRTGLVAGRTLIVDSPVAVSVSSPHCMHHPVVFFTNVGATTGWIQQGQRKKWGEFPTPLSAPLARVRVQVSQKFSASLDDRLCK